MILGIGHDLVAIARIKQAHDKFGQRFLARNFTADEVAYACSSAAQKHARLAKRFAAKEAFSKALGTGIGANAALKEIEVVRGVHLRPIILLHGAAAVSFAQMVPEGMSGHIHLSLSDEAGLASAYVILEARKEGETGH